MVLRYKLQIFQYLSKINKIPSQKSTKIPNALQLKSPNISPNSLNLPKIFPPPAPPFKKSQPLYNKIKKNQKKSKKQMGVYLSQPITSKNINVGSSGNIRFVSGEMQGWRKNMEDAAIHETDIGDGNALFAVFDGHGGPEVSKYVAEIFVQVLKQTEQYKKKDYINALDKTFQKIDEMIDSEQGNAKLKAYRDKLKTNQMAEGGKVSSTTGCTANVVLITKQKYVIANAGDSRSALCRDGTLVVFSEDHKPEDKIEQARIRKAGGNIINGRVNGGLNLTRSFGDFDYKRNTSLDYSQQMITCKPDIRQIAVHPTDQFIIIGCDGIWERFVNNTKGLVDIVRSQYKINKEPKKIMEDILNMLLAKDTRDGIGCDNMTAIFVTLK